MTDRSFNVHMSAATILIVLAVILIFAAALTGLKIFFSVLAVISAVVGLAYAFVNVYRARMAGLI